MTNPSEHARPRSPSHQITPPKNNPSTNTSPSDVNAMTNVQENAELKNLLTTLRGTFLRLLD